MSLAGLMLCLALVSFATVRLGLEADTSELKRVGLARASGPPAGLQWGSWLIESLALLALFLLIQGRGGAWWLDGLLVGCIGWVFRGPVLVLTLVTVSRLGRDPWWPLSLRWLFSYAVAGLFVSFLALKLGVGGEQPGGAANRPEDSVGKSAAAIRAELKEGL